MCVVSMATWIQYRLNKVTTLIIFPSIATLRGHSMAVTSVDWKLIGQQTVIATCADDRVSAGVKGMGCLMYSTIVMYYLSTILLECFCCYRQLGSQVEIVLSSYE